MLLFFKLAPESNAEEIIQSQSGACFGAYKTLQTTAGSIASGVDTWEACTEHCADKTECTAYYFTASNVCKFFTESVSGSATSAEEATTIYRREPCGKLMMFIALCNFLFICNFDKRHFLLFLCPRIRGICQEQ